MYMYIEGNGNGGNEGRMNLFVDGDCGNGFREVWGWVFGFCGLGVLGLGFGVFLIFYGVGMMDELDLIF